MAAKILIINEICNYFMLTLLKDRVIKESFVIKDRVIKAYFMIKDRVIHTIDNKDIDKYFLAFSEITMSPLPKGHIARLTTIHKVKAQ